MSLRETICIANDDSLTTSCLETKVRIWELQQERKIWVWEKSNCNWKSSYESPCETWWKAFLFVKLIWNVTCPRVAAFTFDRRRYFLQRREFYPHDLKYYCMEEENMKEKKERYHHCPMHTTSQHHCHSTHTCIWIWPSDGLLGYF